MPLDETFDLRASPAEAHSLPLDAGHPSVRVLAHGSMEVRWFRPHPGLQHEPHDRDELYFVVSGTARFVRSGQAVPFEEAEIDVAGPESVEVGPGDVLFVPAGAPHDFDDTSPDFAVWAVFYGPEGGEAG